MVAAVAQLLVIDISPLVFLAGLLLYAGYFFALLLVGLYFLFDNRYDFLVDAQIIVQSLGYEVIDIGAYRRTYISVLFPQIGGTELDFGLAFEFRFLNLNRNRTHDALTAVLRSIILLEELLEGLGNCFAVGCKMGSTIPGILAVHE